MPSPFPGVDPFIESQGRWADFHLRFLNYWSEAIYAVLPKKYEVRIVEETIVLPIESKDEGPPEPTARSGIFVINLPAVEEIRTRWINILHQEDGKVVSVLKLLTPIDKNSLGRDVYISKRCNLLVQEVNVVELDLLVGGKRLSMRRPLPKGDCFAIIARCERRPLASVYAWSIRQRLPQIPIPLLHCDGDIVIDFAAIFATVYERARYAKSIDYAAGLANIPLDGESLRWATETGKDATLRQ